MHIISSVSRCSYLLLLHVLCCPVLCCAVLQSDAAAEDKLSQLGSLMDASHASCAGLYECSCAELDALVGAARAAGALGARLSGEAAAAGGS